MENDLIPIQNTVSGPPTAPPPRTVTDLSPRVVQLARMIDRLPPGNYEISLQKQEPRMSNEWSIEIVRTERISMVSLSRQTPPE